MYVYLEPEKCTLPGGASTLYREELRRTDEPQEWRNGRLRLEPRCVLGSFGVVLMSCKVNFHVVPSALRNSMCFLRIGHFSEYPLRSGGGGGEGEGDFFTHLNKLVQSRSRFHGIFL